MAPHPLRVARAGVRVVKANLGRLDRPLKINLCVTYWCQYKCRTCNIWRRKPEDELTTDELLTFVSRNADTEWLDVTGGEIFLRPDIEIVLSSILRSWKRLAVLHFPTNGFLTDRIVPIVERLAGLRAAPIVVTVSVDGDEALNDEIRGVRGGFKRQIETFKAIRTVPGVDAVLGMTVSRLNAGRVRDVFEACRRECGSLEPAEFHLNVAQTSAHYYGTDAQSAAFVPTSDQVRDAIFEYRSLKGSRWRPAAALEDRYLTLLESFARTGVTPMPCHALRSSCFVDPWGVVYPCISFARPVGALRDHDMNLLDVWRSAAAGDLQQQIWKGDCPQCWTACEAYQTILGNALAPWRALPVRRSPVPTEGVPPAHS